MPSSSNSLPDWLAILGFLDPLEPSPGSPVLFLDFLGLELGQALPVIGCVRQVII